MAAKNKLLAVRRHNFFFDILPDLNAGDSYRLQKAQMLLAPGLNVREAATRLKIGKTALFDALHLAGQKTRQC